MYDYMLNILLNYLKNNTTMKNTIIALYIIAGIGLTITGCKKDDDLVDVPQPVVNEQEIITSLFLQLTDSATNTPFDTVAFRDLDGDGANAPIQWDTVRLNANTTYLMSVLLLNEIPNPADTISNEVAEEANDHQFFFNIAGVSLTHTYLDQDTNTPPLPLGLVNKIRTGAAGTGTFQVVLKHQPGIKDGQQTTGDSDVDVTFQTIIQ
jgi:hypothetical protein